MANGWRETPHLLFTLAGNYLVQGRYAEAEALYRRVLNLRDQQSPTRSPDSYILSQLGKVCVAMGKSAEAEILFERALAGYEQEPGLIENWVTTISELVGLYQSQQRWDHAELFLQQRQSFVSALQRDKNLAGEPTPWPDADLILMLKYVNLLMNRGNHEDASSMCRRLISSYKDRLAETRGSENPVKTLALTNGLVYALRGYAVALRSIQRSAEAELVDREIVTLLASID